MTTHLPHEKTPPQRARKHRPKAHRRPPVSPNRKPEGMSLEAWQTELRREFGRQQRFHLENVGREAVFSEFHVTNPATGGLYRVAIRGLNPGDNFCSCPDFSVNTLGTCKHIEFTLAALLKRRGAKTLFRQGYRPPFSEVYLRYGARREVAFAPAGECPPRLRQLATSFFGENGILKPEAFGRFEEFLKAASQESHEVRCYDDALQFIAQVRDDGQRRNRIDGVFPEGARAPSFEGLLKVPLYPYQRRGALFAALAGRCLLADDMGLGKTVQALAAAEILARCEGVERVLVICPTSLKHQWAQEVGRFTERRGLVIQGPLPARAAAYREESFYKITNYEVVERDREAIERWAPDLIVLDEAQRIKNWRTRTARSVKRLSSPYALVLTGTPLENRLDELHSIVEFVDRFRLGPAFRFLAEHRQTDDNGRVTGYKNLSRIATTLAPILLRRSKGEVRLELPERTEKRFFIEMTPQQRAHHEENREIVARIAAKWRRYHFLSDGDQRRLTIALQKMRMACNSTYLLDPSTDYGRKVDEAVDFLLEAMEQDGTKAVVFSQWVRTHELLIRRLEARHIPFVFLHGGVPGSQRGELTRRFKEDPDCRVFLSTDAGGVGLNLQSASVVLNLDLPWNPAVLDQRLGRVHRIGQRRNVLAAHFIAEGTIEHGMLNLLAFKKALFEGVLEGGADEVFLNGKPLEHFMEAVEEAAGAIPAPPPESEPTAMEPLIAFTGEEEEEEEREVESPIQVPGPAPAPATALPSPEGWAGVAAAGLSFLERLSKAMTAAPPEGAGTLVERDATTGQAYLRLPMPDPAVLDQIAGLLGALAGKR